jgi:signal transduction histidine kinase
MAHRVARIPGIACPTNVMKSLHFRLSRCTVCAYAVGIALPLAVTFAGARLSLPAFVFEHLMVLLVVGLAVAVGRGPAIIAAVAGGAGDNVLLREPIGRPAITGMRDAVDLGLFLVVAIVVGWLVDRLRTAKEDAIRAVDRERLARGERDRLIATVTHDLATPLTAIQGTIQFARKHPAPSELDLGRLLLRVETAAARASSLVKALSDAKSIEQHAFTLSTRRLDFRDIVEPIAKMLDRVSERHPIAVAIDATPLVIDGDADRLGRVVENLVTNAIKYSPTGGGVEVCLSKDQEAAVLTVRDHGIGISDDARGRLFGLGYRAPEAMRVAPGLGLGLYTAAEIVRRHGGAIEVGPAEGEGTTFTVRIPLAYQEVSAAQTAGVHDVVATAPSRAVH